VKPTFDGSVLCFEREEAGMAKILFKAFVSCSFATEDEDVNDFFKKLIRSFDIEPRSYDYQEIGRIPDKVKENIIKSDCMIAIATRRKRVEGTDFWSCSDWVQHEITLASAFGKPVVIFVEDGVNIEGLIAMSERRQIFRRDNLVKDIDKIASFLFNLRDHLESTYQAESLQLPVLIRHYVHVNENMLSRELTTTRCEVLMESLIDNLEATHHSIELEETTPGVSLKPRHFDLACREAPSGTKVQQVIVQNTDYKFLWNVVFDPPLKKGQKVRYAFKSVRPNCRPYTHEELTERIARGTYEYKLPVCEACEWHISYPTAELTFVSEFPEGYEIRDFYPDVKIGKARLAAENELKRIKEGNLFAAEEIFDKWVLSLKVPRPLLDHTYYVYYTPPRASELKG
jgi:hypothetical protein